MAARLRRRGAVMPWTRMLPSPIALKDGRTLGTLSEVLGWPAPDGIDCARMRSLQISDRRDRPWNRLAELAWIRRSIFSNFTG